MHTRPWRWRLCCPEGDDAAVVGWQVEEVEELLEKIQNLGQAAAQHAAHLATLQQKVDRTHQEQRDLGPAPQVRLSFPSAF